MLGPRAYINVLWVKKNKRRRGIGTKLVHEAIKWAKLKGYKYLDTIPEKNSIGFYIKLKFEQISSQVKAIKKLKCPPLPNIDYELRELKVGELLLNMKLVTGTYRPGLFIWYSAWEDGYLPPQEEPLAYKLVMEGNIFTILLDYYGENEVSLILWSTIKPTSTMP